MQAGVIRVAAASYSTQLSGSLSISPSSSCSQRNFASIGSRQGTSSSKSVRPKTAAENATFLCKYVRTYVKRTLRRRGELSNQSLKQLCFALAPFLFLSSGELSNSHNAASKGKGGSWTVKQIGRQQQQRLKEGRDAHLPLLLLLLLRYHRIVVSRSNMRRRRRTGGEVRSFQLNDASGASRSSQRPLLFDVAAAAAAAAAVTATRRAATSPYASIYVRMYES